MKNLFLFICSTASTITLLFIFSQSPSIQKESTHHKVVNSNTEEYRNVYYLSELLPQSTKNVNILDMN